ncbi:integrin beta-1-binding protein 2 [Anolis sagrei]|uniref:integrin beta-1-binding protein 2 n=1 Tax=Anolis sagrei TaxID=38937 RepID=UPI00352209B7
MALLCYNRGCGQQFDPEENSPDACLHHPGFPIFHDALKGWSCCRKRTTDFSEFLSIKGCTKGRHSNEKPPEPQEAPRMPKDKAATEIIVQGPKSAEKMERERPSSDEPKQLLPVKVSKTLEQSLEKLELSPKEEAAGQGSAGAALEVSLGTTCKNSGCKATFQGQESNMETCTFHPGVPVFHEGMKYWSCCGIKTTDFNAFLEQKGCSRGRHLWVKKQDKKLVSCRQDWHQTSSQVVVTLYAKTPLPELSSVKANRTSVDIHIVFEGDKIFQAELELWGVIDVQRSAVNLLPSKVEITLQKAPPLTWARLEHPQSRAEPPKGPEVEASDGQGPLGGPAEEESDDSLSWSSEEEDWEEGSAGPISSQSGGN